MTCVPDSCIVNIYEQEILYLHMLIIMTSLDISVWCHFLVSVICILVQASIKIVSANMFDDQCVITLLVGFVLVFNRNMTDVAKHYVPACIT